MSSVPSLGQKRIIVLWDVEGEDRVLSPASQRQREDSNFDGAGLSQKKDASEKGISRTNVHKYIERKQAERRLLVPSFFSLFLHSFRPTSRPPSATWRPRPAAPRAPPARAAAGAAAAAAAAALLLRSAASPPLSANPLLLPCALSRASPPRLPFPACALRPWVSDWARRSAKCPQGAGLCSRERMQATSTTAAQQTSGRRSTRRPCWTRALTFRSPTTA